MECHVFLLLLLSPNIQLRQGMYALCMPRRTNEWNSFWDPILLSEVPRIPYMVDDTFNFVKGGMYCLP